MENLKELQLPESLIRISDMLHRQNITPVIVGGFVRDIFLGEVSKDIDVECFGTDIDTLQELLEFWERGNVKVKRTDVNGVFPNLIVVDEVGNEFDFTIPRLERNIGSGHTSFTVEPVRGEFSDALFAVAAARRDLTINSMGIHIPERRLIDPFEGLDDLMAGVAHPVSDRFKEDPLRVLRAAQFTARFNLSPSQKMVDTMYSLRKELRNVSKERVFKELQKMLLKSKSPSMGLRLLKNTECLEFCFPHLHDLDGVLQQPNHHPEGDVLEHTFQVLDEAAKISEGLPEEKRLTLMLAALCHDIGKARTQNILSDQKITFYGHEKCTNLFKQFCKNLKLSNTLTEEVVLLSELHMRQKMCTRKSVRRLLLKFPKLRPELLVMLMKADRLGRGDLAEVGDDTLKFESFVEMAKDYISELPSKHKVVTGKELLDMGYIQGPKLGELQREAEELFITGISREKILELFSARV